MFSKKESSVEAIIGAESSIKGDLTTTGVARMDGAIDGNIYADWLIIGETGTVKGDVASRGVVINGKIKGNIQAKEIVEIKSKGIVEGDIYTTRLVVSEGAVFDGHSYMQKFIAMDNKDVLPFEQKVKKPLSD